LIAPVRHHQSENLTNSANRGQLPAAAIALLSGSSRVCTCQLASTPMTKSAKTLPRLYEALDRLQKAFDAIPREHVRTYWQDQRSHPEIAKHFAERDAIVEELRAHPEFADLEVDLRDMLGEKIGQDARIARAVYGALCNVEWIHRDGARYTCTWRDAAGVVAEIRNAVNSTNEDYMDWSAPAARALS
jgi:hypothetical protein